MGDGLLAKAILRFVAGRSCLILTTYFLCSIVCVGALPQDIAGTLRLAKEICAHRIHSLCFGWLWPTSWTHAIIVASSLLLCKLPSIAVTLPVDVKVLGSLW